MGVFLNRNKAGNDTENKKTFVIITGCAGAGKTSIGKIIASKNHWAYIDKDTVTRYLTDRVLEEKGMNRGDRESEFYCSVLRPLEYKSTFKVCDENLRIGNSVVLTIPFLIQIQDYSLWEALIKEYSLDLSDVNVKFIWITHDEGGEHTRIINRNAERDKYKMEHWDEYIAGLEGIEPDKRYNAYVFNNDSASADELYVEDVLKWIRK